MKNNKLKLLIIVLVFFLMLSLTNYKDTLSIYKTNLSTQISLTILDSSTTYEVKFDLDYDNNKLPSSYVGYNQPVGTLPVPSRTNYNFLGWYDGTGNNANRIYSDEIITDSVTFYAKWQKIICKKVTDNNNLHTEKCESGGCRVSGLNNTFSVGSDITYGTKYGASSPIAGDAYNCDVNNDGTYDATTQYGKFTERFYFLRFVDNGNDEQTGALVYYTSIDSNGPADSQHNSSIGSTTYNEALAWLPTKTSTITPWNNPGLIDFDADNGKISRLLNFDDLTNVCGPISGEKPTSYFASCSKWFLFENSKFQSSQYGRAGIWLQPVGSQYYRIQAETVQVAAVETSSKNTIRPVIEIPISAFEGFKNTDKHTITFDTHGGTPQIETKRIYTGDPIGTIDTITREHYTFDGWYENYANGVYSNQVTQSTIVESDMTLHAKWNPIPTNTITLDANGGTIEGESTYDYIVDTGNTIDKNDLPVPTYLEHTFDGWYIDDELTEPFDDTDPITDNITLYAKWIISNNVARVNGTGYSTLAEAIAAVPTGKVKTTITILQNITLSDAVTIPNNTWVELDIGEKTISGTGNLITNNGNLDIINGTISVTNVAENSIIIKNTTGAILNISGGTISSSNSTNKNYLISNGQNATLNITGGTLNNNCYVSGTTEFLVIENNGNTTISGGNISSYGQSATINQTKGTLIVSGGRIVAHNVTKGQAIYISGGTTNIRGNAYLENVSGTGESRGCVDNNGGTLNITGGTVVSKGYSAVTIRKNSTTQIGTDDSIIDISTPVLRGKNYGLEKASTATTPTINVYDGIFESLNQEQAISTTSVTNKPQDIDFKTDGTISVEGITYHTAYLLAPSITINFYEETNGTAIPVVVENGGTFGSNLPTPSPKQGYLFAGWFIDGDPLKPVTSATVVTGPFIVYAKWVQSVSNATMDSSMSIQINTTDTIEFEEDDIEDVTYVSSDTTVATVDADGTVHAVDVGTATITITGSLSSDTRMVTVTVTQIKHTVKFYDADYDPNDLEHSTLLNTVEVISESSISNMPTEPTNQYYVFNAWYINGNSTTPFTNETIVTGDMVVVANWKEKITYAVLSTNPSPFDLIVGNTGQITLTAYVQGDAVEDYTFTSGNTNYATVNTSTGVVTGAGIGDTNITVTGTLSGLTVQVPVSVDILKYTVTFKDGNTVIDEVEVPANTAIGNANMPANPSKTNYIFNGWVYGDNNTLTPFTSAVQIGGNIDVFASWKEEIDIATLPEDPLTIMLGNSKQIVVSPTGEGNLVEDYTLSSSDTNILEVNGKIITGASAGTVTLTITGAESNKFETITVEVLDSYAVTFDPDNGETPSVIHVEIGSSIDDSGETLPSNPTIADYVFDNWYIYENGSLTTTRLDTTATINNDITYKAKWVDDTYVAAVYGTTTTYKTTLAAAISAVSNSSSAEIRILQDIINPSGRTTISNSKDITIDANGHTLSCDDNGSTSGNLLYVAGGTLRLKNGTFTCSKAGLATLETSGNEDSYGYLYIENGAIVTNTGDRGAIYNSGTVYINGGWLESSTGVRSTITNGSATARVEMSSGTVMQTATSYTSDTKNNGKGAIKVVKGTVIITGGTVISYSTDSAAIDHTGGGTLIIGVDDADNSYDVTTPVIQGEQYGINATSAYSIYDGIIKGKSNNQAVNTFNNITETETGSTRQTGTDGNYYTLYYTSSQAKYHIDFDANNGTVTPAYKEFDLNSPITASDLPEPTRTNYTFDGWYTDNNFQTPFATFTPTSADTVTYHAKWIYLSSSFTPVSHNILSNAMQDYFTNVSTWVTTDATDPSNEAPNTVPPQTQNAAANYDNGHHLFKASIDEVFTDNGCSPCGQDNACSSPQAGIYCDQPSGYDTGIGGDVNVYLYENNTKGNQVTYTTSTGGVIYNMIPGKTYLWESATDSSKYGVVTATGSRRTLKTSVRNLRDLGGLSASNSDVSGTIDYGRLYRGAQITSQQGVTDLTKLGITREVDLRGNNDGNQTYKMANYDTGTSSTYTDIVMTNYIVNPASTTYITAAHLSEYRAVKSAMRAIMGKVVFNNDNIFFHCTIGSDRTGTIAYFLEGLLGVSEENRLRDYEMTYFFGLTNRTRFHDSVSWSGINPRFYSMYRSYPTNQDIYNYYTYESHTPDPNNPNDLTDDELLRRFRLALIH